MNLAGGITYENKFIGIGCKLDSNWAFYTDEEIKEMVRKCSRDYRATQGSFKVLRAEDMEAIYKMAK